MVWCRLPNEKGWHDPGCATEGPSSPWRKRSSRGCQSHLSSTSADLASSAASWRWAVPLSHWMAPRDSIHIHNACGPFHIGFSQRVHLTLFTSCRLCVSLASLAAWIKVLIETRVLLLAPALSPSSPKVCSSWRWRMQILSITFSPEHLCGEPQREKELHNLTEISHFFFFFT